MTDEHLTWEQAFSNAVAIVEGAYSLSYAPRERAALRETCSRYIKQPLHLVRIAKLIPGFYKLFGDRLPTPEFWRRMHKEVGYVAPNTFGQNCDKCADTGWIEYAFERFGREYTAVALCNCAKGRWLNSHYQPPKRYFEDRGNVAVAIQEGRIKIENGRAIDVETGELAISKKKVEPEPEPAVVQGEFEDDVPF